MKIDRWNRKQMGNKFTDDYHLAIEMQIVGRGAGVFYIEIKDGKMNIEPYCYNKPDAKSKA